MPGQLRNSLIFLIKLKFKTRLSKYDRRADAPNAVTILESLFLAR
jgi:hypothetical protein